MADDMGLTPARVLAERASKPFPNDSAQYREARTALLAEEIELRRHIERVAAQRRALPPGGEIPRDYEFTDEAGKTVKLSHLFGESDTLIVYSWMFGPQRERPCPMCTAMLSALDGEARDIMQRVPLAIIGRSPIERQVAFKRERGWRNLKLYATRDDDFSLAYRGVGPDGEDWAEFNIFRRDPDGTIRHFWSGEMGGETADPGQDPRGAPDPMPLWTLLDMTPEGRGTDWYPSLDYADDKSGGGQTNVAAVKGILDAYANKDRAAAERLIAEDFHFTSPLDNRIDRKTYFERCWPNSETAAGFEFVNLVPFDDKVIVTYEARSTSGKRFRNTEIMTLRGGKIVEVEVYFGWDLPHKAASGGFVDQA